MQQLLVSRREAATALGVSLRTLDYLLARHELRSRRIGRRKMIPCAELEKFAARGSGAAKKVRDDGASRK